MEHGRLDSGSACGNLGMLGSLGNMNNGVWDGRDVVPGVHTTVNIMGGCLILMCN